MAKKLRRQRRERFLPFAYRRSGIDSVVRRVFLDGAQVALDVDRDRRLVPLEDDVWQTASLEVHLEITQQLLTAVLPPSEIDAPPVELVLVLRCVETRLRRAIKPTGSRLRPGTFTTRVELHRTELFGTAELRAYLVRSDPCLHRQPGFAWAAGARLASSRPWELRLERKRPTAGRFLDVRYRSFAEDEVLTPFRKNLYRLELDQDAPILWVNTDHDKLTPILSDKGSTGKRARLREVFYDVIAHGVWAQLFVRAAEDIRAQGELTYDWEDAVLIELLPMILPGHRSHTQRVAGLRRALQRDGLAVVMERLDAALQHRSELTRHMTRLVEETVEAPSA